MNILYCGDQNIADGVFLSVLSLLAHTTQPLRVYLLTAEMESEGVRPLPSDFAKYLDCLLKERRPGSGAVLQNITPLFAAQPPAANRKTRFTPMCMLRLYADEAPCLPDHVLYLDSDVLCRRDPTAFYQQDMTGWELAGVLDHYGKWFFRRSLRTMDYLNSGVLLLNLNQIRESGLFARCRARCQEKRMFLPDQSAINKLARSKKICPRKYNEQRRLREDTVFQHFTTSFRLLPWPHAVRVKPWDIERLHSVLKLYEYDDLLEEYQTYQKAYKGE